MEEKKCLICGMSLEGLSKYAKYCSAKCKTKARNERVKQKKKELEGKRVCKFCGKDITHLTLSAHYCNVECSRNYTKKERKETHDKKTLNKVCKFCKKDISHLSSCAKFCSRDCLLSYNREQTRLKRISRTEECLVCGKTFNADNNSKFCSEECKEVRKRLWWESGNLKQKEKRTKPIKKCLYCEKELDYKTNKKYCNSDCRNALLREKKKEKRENTIVFCKFCNKQLETKNPKAKFCNSKCVNDYYNQKRKDKIKEDKENNLRFCLECGKQLSKDSHYNKEFCDNDCMLQFRYKKQNKEKFSLREDEVPVCKICGRKADRLSSHLRQTHNMSVEDYCKQFNVDKKDLVSEKYRKCLSEAVSGSKNYWYNHGGKFSIYSKNYFKYDGLSEDEINKILDKLNLKNYSKISQELFWIIYEKTKNRNEIYFAELNHEYYFKNNNKTFIFDFVDLNKKKIIEFHGDFWHANPKDYKANDIVNFPNNPTLVKEVWESDNEKLDFIKSKGFEVLVIWESDYRKDKNSVIEKCIEFLK